MSNPKQPGRLKNFLGIAFFYFLGFILTRKGSTDTTMGTIMMVAGWLLLILSMILAVMFVYQVFKDAFNKKK
ncbi:hypothetical protein ABS768_04870 [Flavobacterium sp. ST-75]|uniref:DUF485 domain-containing protein n=1 Tax=Flavobacterium rhizophilum TaxID=3163296 RepID=A0ABW8Y9D8_9FLAO